MAVSETPKKLLIAASGTGGHLFPAIATAEQLPDFTVEWLGVPDRLETELVPDQYPLHTVRLGGFQGRLGLGTLRLLGQVVNATRQVRALLKRGQFDGVFTTGGYIAAPAILAARSLGLPAILHESNALPGKVTRWLSPWCSQVALGFEAATSHLPKAQSVVVGPPVRSQFLQAATLPDAIAMPDDAPLILVIGGSQGAVAVNRLVRAAAPETDANIRKAIDTAVAAMSAIKERAETKERYDQMLAVGNGEGNAAIQRGVDALIAQARELERGIAVLGLEAIAFEGSDSLDAPDRVGAP